MIDHTDEPIHAGRAETVRPEPATVDEARRDRQGLETALWQDEVVPNEAFYQSLKAHPVPVLECAVRCSRSTPSTTWVLRYPDGWGESSKCFQSTQRSF
jgi:hypothetical protein